MSGRLAGQWDFRTSVVCRESKGDPSIPLPSPPSPEEGEEKGKGGDPRNLNFSALCDMLH